MLSRAFKALALPRLKLSRVVNQRLVKCPLEPHIVTLILILRTIESARGYSNFIKLFDCSLVFCEMFALRGFSFVSLVEF